MVGLTASDVDAAYARWQVAAADLTQARRRDDATESEEVVEQSAWDALRDVCDDVNGGECGHPECPHPDDPAWRREMGLEPLEEAS